MLELDTSSETRNMSSRLHDIMRLVMTSALSDQEIGHSLNVAKNTVRRYRQLATQAQFVWSELALLDNEALDARFNKAKRRLTQKRKPDFALVHQELQRTG